jgi:hypothetical protein
MTKRVYKKKYARKHSRKTRGGNDPETGYEGDNELSNQALDDTSDISPILPNEDDEQHQIIDDNLNFDNDDDDEQDMSLGPLPENSTLNTTNEHDSHVQGLGAPPANGDVNNLNFSMDSSNDNSNGQLNLSDLNNSLASSNNTSMESVTGGTRKRRRNKSRKSKKSKKSRKTKKTKKSRK